jgi:hypothetical protein
MARTYRYLRVARPHIAEDGTAVKRNDLRVCEVPDAELGFKTGLNEQVERLLKTGNYVEVPDGQTRLPDIDE